MDKILAPERLVAEPNTPAAEKEFKYWKCTFENFLEEWGDKVQNKLRCLIKYVSASVYEYIAEAETYEAALAILDKLFIKKTNEIFSRHLLATRKQRSEETLDQ